MKQKVWSLWCHFIMQYINRKIGSNTFEKKKSLCLFMSATARQKKPKKSFSSDWAENLAESNKGLFFRPGEIAEGVVERLAKRRMRSVGSHINI